MPERSGRRLADALAFCPVAEPAGALRSGAAAVVCLASLLLALTSCGSTPVTTRLPCQLGAPRAGCVPPQLVANFLPGISTARMVAFSSSLVKTRAQVSALAGSAFSVDYDHRALLVVWGPHVTEASENVVIAQLKASHDFRSISRH